MERDEVILLEDQIKENVEWLSTIEGDEIECISVENLEAILNKFLNLKKIKLELKTNK